MKFGSRNFGTKHSQSLPGCHSDEERSRGSARGSNNAPDVIWKSIWQLDVPNKIKHFMWRLAHNSHPLRGNLIQRGMKIIDKCVVCGATGEDGGIYSLSAKWLRKFGDT